MRRAILASFLLFNIGPVWSQDAGDFAPFMVLDDAPGLVVLNGAIDARTPLAFRRVLAERPQARILILNSPGGDVQSALLVAEHVYERKMGTFIIEDFECYSACALVYFAGALRIAEGKLGVHQISGSADLEAAQLNLSDIIEYLSKYGVSAEVITRMLRTPPDDMYVFSQVEIAALGINRTIGEDDAPLAETPRQSPAIQQPPRPPASASLPSAPAASPDELAKAFVLGIIMTGSLPKHDLVELSKNIYSDNVDFYGKKLTLSDVIADKVSYADRWPVRSSTARHQTVRTHCDAGICRVSGVYDWAVSNPTRKASLKGSATFTYLIDMRAGYKVIEEGGKVLSRE